MELPMNPFSLASKTVVVTGAGSGIGKSVAGLFVARGAVVAIFEPDIDVTNKAVAEINAAATKIPSAGKAVGYKCDVADEASVKAAFDSFVKEHKRLDILVNNAGINAAGNIETATGDDLDKLYKVNIKGMFHAGKHAVLHMKAANAGRGGSIINLASITSLVGVKDTFAYGMTKGAVVSMTRSIATDYVHENIRCNCVCPGPVLTPFVTDFLERAFPGDKAAQNAQVAEFAKWVPVGRFSKPEEIASLVLYLASDESSFVTGAAYAIDGGRSGCAL